MFDRRSEAPKQFSELIGDEISKRWMPRKTQIVPIERPFGIIFEIVTFFS